MSLDAQVGAIVRNLRLERNMSQQQLADLLCYGRRRISKLENGQIAVNVTILFDIANALQIDIYSLLPVKVRLKRESDSLHSSNGTDRTA